MQIKHMMSIILLRHIVLGVHGVYLSVRGIFTELGRYEELGHAVEAFFKGLVRAGEVVVSAHLGGVGVCHSAVIAHEFHVFVFGRVLFSSLEKHML